MTRHADRAKYVTAMVDRARRALAWLMVRRRQLVEMRVAQSNRLEQAEGMARPSIQSTSKLLDKPLGMSHPAVGP